jgi:hypothetical protein
MALAMTALAAREHGDAEVAEAILRAFDEGFDRRMEGGVLHYERSSTIVNVVVLLSRLLRTGDWRNMLLAGPPAEIHRGPILAEAAYPDVLVAKARSDGERLSLVLYPDAGTRREWLGVKRLAPRRRYEMRTGGGTTSVVADAWGEARFEVLLDGRTQVDLVPA